LPWKVREGPEKGVARRRLILGVLLAVLGLAAGAAALWGVSWRERTPILVGLLHSQTGPWATVEKSMLEGELLAIEEINAAGGLLGRPVRAVIADGRSDARTFARQAERLIYDEKVSVLIGCWESEARKAVRPVVEDAQHLLIYPPSYEGMEQSPNIVYVGGPTNQQIIPAVSWCREVRKARTFFLIGSDSLWARALGAVIKDQLHALGGELLGEVFLDGGDTAGGSGRIRNDVNQAVARIAKAAPDVVLSTVEGPDSLAFYGRMRHDGLTPEKVPVISFILEEEAVRRLPIADVTGQYAAWSYFQSVARPENLAFVREVRAKLGRDRAISDCFQIAYQSVRIWAETVDDAETDDVQVVNRQILRQSIDAPEGIIAIDTETRHGWRPFYLGKLRPDGQFDIVWSLSKPIRPIPYPASRSRADWNTLVDTLMATQRGQPLPRPEQP
jgi:urea transport system substrate-binding protein